MSPNQGMEIHILFPSMECNYQKFGGSILRFVGMKIDVSSGMWSNLGKGNVGNIHSNFGIESWN